MTGYPACGDGGFASADSRDTKYDLMASRWLRIVSTRPARCIGADDHSPRPTGPNLAVLFSPEMTMDLAVKRDDLAEGTGVEAHVIEIEAREPGQMAAIPERPGDGRDIGHPSEEPVLKRGCAGLGEPWMENDHETLR